jgi:predicted nucleic acid-binding protein
MPTDKDVFVDTSGWAYYLDRSDPLYPEVFAVIQNVVQQRRRLVTTNYILTELVVLLSSRYHLPRPQVIAALKAIRTDSTVEIIHIEQSIDHDAWELLEARLDKEWSLVDASSFVVMRRLGITQALTTDHHFTQAGFMRLPVVERYRK